jgi:hypothetical protein
MAYDTNEEFSCPNCGLDGDIIEHDVDEPNGSTGKDIYHVSFPADYLFQLGSMAMPLI